LRPSLYPFRVRENPSWSGIANIIPKAGFRSKTFLKAVPKDRQSINSSKLGLLQIDTIDNARFSSLIGEFFLSASCEPSIQTGVCMKKNKRRRLRKFMLHHTPEPFRNF
jgi:hypothetical protein